MEWRRWRNGKPKIALLATGGALRSLHPFTHAGEGGACSGALEDMAGLSPLLTPSNNKLCAAIVDAF